jgi:multiple sugar transport system ATP-binding protein
MAQVSLRDVVKLYGRMEVVNSLSLTIEDGGFVAPVGPSGCGNATTLNQIAGLPEFSGGEVFIGDRLVNDLDAKDRDVAVVLQHYARYPNKSICKKLAFPLQIRKLASAEIDRRVREAALVLGIIAMLRADPIALTLGATHHRPPGQAPGGRLSPTPAGEVR